VSEQRIVAMISVSSDQVLVDHARFVGSFRAG
jgi:hypothetical protein